MYQPTIWSHDFIQVLDDNSPINLKEKLKELEKKVKVLNVDFENGCFSALELLEHIDHIERLGLGYRFQNDIRRLLDVIALTYGRSVGLEKRDDSLHEASLKFRILRQYGYNVSEDFLRRFKDKNGGFIESLQTDVKGLLSLYEASYLAFMEESDLYEARLFAMEHLLKLKDQENEALGDINHPLEFPLYQSMLRLQARDYIDACHKRQDVNFLLRELATLDFNMIQFSNIKIGIYLNNNGFSLYICCSWWKNIGLAQKLCFVRDRLVECFFWTVGMVFEPEYHSCRVGLTKVGTLITVIDDIYDVYGSLDELDVFTDAVKRWDINATDHMPKYLQIGFGALFNTITEMGSYAPGENITPILVKVWGELLEAFLVEAKWNHRKCIPTLQDYLDNAWQSVSGVVILTHRYFLINQEIKNEIAEPLEKYHDLMKWSSMVFRLYNDLATLTDEIESGKSVNAISCYMHEVGVCEAVAHAYITTLIDEAWRKLIKVHLACFQELPNPFIDMAINLARISRYTYHQGDGHGAPDARAKERVVSVIIEPIGHKV
ncbi:(E)-beta-ocimene synthase, chloroplastic-like [Bidens hawaiensis]|uniref:(E)-beta-ocimene synthase, chloroplastic-like n=1 Tax=Bidens hawaiensis TaxID=980011 RepID=UPI004049A401